MASKKSGKKKTRCWTGYKPKPGSVPYADGSCIKETYQRMGKLIAELKSPTAHSIDVFHKKLGNAGAGEAKRGEAAIKASDEAKKTRTKRLKAIGEASAAWQRSEGKNPKGGLNAKGRKSYEAANPGSDLKAPQPEGGSRKKSFCARMSGMRKRQKDSNNTGKDRLSLSLKKWKC